MNAWGGTGAEKGGGGQSRRKWGTTVIVSPTFLKQNVCVSQIQDVDNP